MTKSRMDSILATVVVAILIQCLDCRADSAINSIHFELGVYNFQIKDWGSAIREFSEVIYLEPTNFLALDYRGNAFWMNGNLDMATLDFDVALANNPKDELAAFNLATVYRARGRFERSLSCWNEYMRLNPTNAAAYKSRASVYNALDQFEDAIKDWNEGLRLGATDATAFTMRGYSYFKVGQFDKADHDFIEAVQLEPTNGIALNNLAWFRATCPAATYRNGKEAIEVATKACELAKWTRWEWVDTLAAAHAEAGQFDKAVSFEKQAILMAGEHEKDLQTMQDCLKLYEKRKPDHEGQK